MNGEQVIQKLYEWKAKGLTTDEVRARYLALVSQNQTQKNETTPQVEA